MRLPAFMQSYLLNDRNVRAKLIRRMVVGDAFAGGLAHSAATVVCILFAICCSAPGCFIAPFIHFFLAIFATLQQTVIGSTLIIRQMGQFGQNNFDGFTPSTHHPEVGTTVDGPI